jgi:hypothetical protein
MNESLINHRINLGQMYLNERFGYEQNARTGEIVPPKLRSLFYHNRYNRYIMDRLESLFIDWSTVKNGNIDVLTTEKSIMAALTNIQKDDGLLLLTDNDNNILYVADDYHLVDAASNRTISYIDNSKNTLPANIRQKIAKGYYISCNSHGDDIEPLSAPFKGTDDMINREQDRKITQNWTQAGASNRRKEKQLGRVNAPEITGPANLADRALFFKNSDKIASINDAIFYYNSYSKIINNAVKKVIKCFENNGGESYIDLANRLKRATDEYLQYYRDFLDVVGKLPNTTVDNNYSYYSLIVDEFNKYVDEIISVAESCCNIPADALPAAKVAVMKPILDNIQSLIRGAVRPVNRINAVKSAIRDGAYEKMFSDSSFGPTDYALILRYANNPLKKSTELCALICKESGRFSDLAETYKNTTDEFYARHRISRGVRRVCQNLTAAAKAIGDMSDNRSIETGIRKIVKEYILFIKLVNPYIVKNKLPGSNERDVLYRKLNAIAKRLNTAISESAQRSFRPQCRLR